MSEVRKKTKKWKVLTAAVVLAVSVWTGSQSVLAVTAVSGTGANSASSKATASGTNAVAVGDGATASGESATAVGNGATANNTDTVAIGLNAKAAGYDSVVIGASSSALANQTVVVGSDSTATSNAIGAAVLGYWSISSGSYSTSIGYVARAMGAQSIAIGDRAKATATGAIAIGAANVNIANTGEANGLHSITIGTESSTNTDYSLAFGKSAKVGTSGTTGSGGLNGIAIGATAKVTADNSVAFGYGASATAANAVALGQGSLANTANTISVGTSSSTRKIVNVTAGSATTDAANYGQLVKNTTYTASNGSVTIQNNAGGTAFTINGLGTDSGIVDYNTSSKWLSTDFGSSVTHGTNSTAYGSGANASASYATAVGYNSKAYTNYSLALGGATVGTSGTVGSGGIYGIAVGYNAKISANNSVALGYGASATAANAVALGQGSLANTANTISVGTSSSTRKIVNVTAGSATTDAANYGQLVKNTTYTASNGSVTIQNNASGTAFTIDGLNSANGTIEEDETEAISGGTAYAYLNPANGDYVKSGATTGINLKALDTKIGSEKAITDLYVVGDNLEQKIYNVAQTRVASNQTVSFESGKNVIKDVADNPLVTFTPGAVAQNNNNMVSGGQVWANDVANDDYELGTDGYFTVKKNNGTETAFRLKLSGDGAITENNTALITGGTAYTYLNPTDGAVVRSGATTAANLNALDDALVDVDTYTVQDGQVVVKNNKGEAAFTITGIGSGSGDSTIVRVSTDDSSEILIGRSTTGADYSAVKTIDVSNGDENYRKITGVADGTLNNDAANYGQLASYNNGNAYTMDEDGVITVKTNAQGEAFKLKITEEVGEVAANNKGFITGGKVYDYVSPTRDGSYVKTGALQNTAENLLALDDKIGTAIGVDGVYEADDTVETQISKVAQARIKGDQKVSFDTDKNVITDAAGNTLVTFEQGEVAQDNTKMVSGGQVWKNDIANAEYTMDNDGVITVNKNDTTEAFKLKISGNGTIEEGNAGLITGGTAYTYLNPADGAVVQSGATTGANLKALDDALVKKDGSFAVDENGNVTVLNNVDGTAFTITGLSTADSKIVRVNENDRSQILVGRGDTYSEVKTIDVSNGDENYRKITGVAAGENTNDAVNYGQLVKNDTYEVGEDGLITVETNKDGGEAFKLKISGNGTIASGNAGLITGGTAYTELRPATDGTYVKTAETTATNLKALDTKLGEEQAGNYYTDAKSSVETKLKALDTKIGEAKGADGVYEAGDTIETQISKVAQARIKGDQYVSFESGKNVIKDAAGNTLVTFEQGAVEANNTKMVSGGQVWNNDVKNKDYELGTDGYFTVENNEGNQAFRLKLSGNGSIADGNTGLITGGTAYTYLNPTSGAVVQSGATTAANLNALDDALVDVDTYTVQDGQVVVKNNKGGTAFTITGIGSGSGDSTIVRVSTDDPSEILIGRSTAGADYSAVKTIDVSNGGENYRKITGVAEGVNTNDAANYGQLLAVQDYEAKDGSLTLKTNAGTEFKITGLGSGSGTEYTAGNGIAIADNTISASIGDGLKFSDSKITVNVDDNSIKVKDGALYVNANGEVADANTGLVTGSQVWNAIQNHTTPVETVSVEDVFNYKPGVGQYYAKPDLTLSEDITALDTGLHDTYNQLIKIKDYAVSNGSVTLETNGGQTFNITGLGSGSGSGTTYTAGNGIAIETTSDNTSTISVKVDGDDLTVSDRGLAVKKDGKVESGNTGLVTGGTVYDAMKTMDNQVTQLSNDINKVGAGAAALAALHPEGYDPNDKLSFAVGYGHYKGENAGALGAFFKPNADTTVSVAGTVGNGDSMMNMGVSFKLGNKGKKAGTYRSAVDLVQRIDALEAVMDREIQRNDKQDSRLNAQEQKIAQLQADIARMQQQIASLLSDNGMVIR